MATAFTFLGILLMSLVVALLAALELADFFRTGDEFVPVMIAIAVFASAANTAFAVIQGYARRERAIHWVAVALAMLAVVLASSPWLVEYIARDFANPYAVGIENGYLALELAVPMLLTVLVQWGLVRQRWRRGSGNDPTRWPWVTIAVAGLAILNPVGLAILASALRHDPTDWLWQLWATVTAIACFVLVVMAFVECYIRGRVLRRRLEKADP